MIALSGESFDCDQRVYSLAANVSILLRKNVYKSMDKRLVLYKATSVPILTAHFADRTIRLADCDPIAGRVRCLLVTVMFSGHFPTFCQAPFDY